MKLASTERSLAETFPELALELKRLASLEDPDSKKPCKEHERHKRELNKDLKRLEAELKERAGRALLELADAVRSGDGGVTEESRSSRSGSRHSRPERWLRRARPPRGSRRRGGAGNGERAPQQSSAVNAVVAAAEAHQRETCKLAIKEIVSKAARIRAMRKRLEAPTEGAALREVDEGLVRAGVAVLTEGMVGAEGG